MYPRDSMTDRRSNFGQSGSVIGGKLEKVGTDTLRDWLISSNFGWKKLEQIRFVIGLLVPTLVPTFPTQSSIGWEPRAGATGWAKNSRQRFSVYLYPRFSFLNQWHCVFQQLMLVD